MYVCSFCFLLQFLFGTHGIGNWRNVVYCLLTQFQFYSFSRQQKGKQGLEKVTHKICNIPRNAYMKWSFQYLVVGLFAILLFGGGVIAQGRSLLFIFSVLGFAFPSLFLLGTGTAWQSIIQYKSDTKLNWKKGMQHSKPFPSCSVTDKENGRQKGVEIMALLQSVWQVCDQIKKICSQAAAGGVKRVITPRLLF